MGISAYGHIEGSDFVCNSVVLRLTGQTVASFDIAVLVAMPGRIWRIGYIIVCCGGRPTVASIPSTVEWGTSSEPSVPMSSKELFQPW